MNLTASIKHKPFLRWAGGKIWLQKHIEQFLPLDFNNYYEPFLGGASTYINLASSKKIRFQSYLSDDNKDLINCYNVIKSNVDALIKELAYYKNEREFYYEQRARTCDSNIEKAANFIFLNRTSFNGIYRVNRKGIYNVPYGNKKYEQLFDLDNLRLLNEMFYTANFGSNDFEHIKESIKKDDFVFLDPPYTVAHENNGFVGYNEKIFSWKDQERLANLCDYLNSVGASFILTNAAHKSIKSLFSDRGSITELLRPCVVGGTLANRSLYKEYIITNIIK